MRVALDATNDLSGKNRSGLASSDGSLAHRESPGCGQSKSSSSRPAASSSCRSVKMILKRGRKSTKDKKETQRAIKQAASFFNANAFHQQAAEDAPVQPSFTDRNKKDALK